MLDIKRIRDDFQNIKERLTQRGEVVDLEKIIQQDDTRKTLQKKGEKLKREKNIASDKIAAIKRKGGDAEKEIKVMKEVSEQVKDLDRQTKECYEGLYRMLLEVPNVPFKAVPAGSSEKDNPVIKVWGKHGVFRFEVKSHVDIGKQLDILDFTRGAKIAGSRFVVYKGPGARLERALINFMLDIHTGEHGYKEISPPFLVNKDSMTGTGQLPKFEEDLFCLRDDEYYLIPTAEVPLTNIFKDEILSSSELPIYLTAYTPCFRREAGSYGKDTIGLIRQHQFDKVELVKFVEPEHSYYELEKLLNDAEKILQQLNIPYRIIELCTGDLGFASAKTYDIEVWLPCKGEYKEISSCSNFEDFQARRARIRYKKAANAKPEFVHTLNGSGVAVGRLVVAILENYQQEDGSVIIPGALQEYMDGMERITN